MSTNIVRRARWAGACWSVLTLTVAVLASSGQGPVAAEVHSGAVVATVASSTEPAPMACDTCADRPSVQEWPGTIPLGGREYRVFSDAYATSLSRTCGVSGG
jgi:hypothetical protein